MKSSLELYGYEASALSNLTTQDPLSFYDPEEEWFWKKNVRKEENDACQHFLLFYYLFIPSKTNKLSLQSSANALNLDNSCILPSSEGLR